MFRYLKSKVNKTGKIERIKINKFFENKIYEGFLDVFILVKRSLFK